MASDSGCSRIGANIRADGSVDMEPEELPLEVVVAAPHALLVAGDQTERILRTVSTPGVNILGTRAADADEAGRFGAMARRVRNRGAV